jgi:multisubunit Na+/H+ antiporter MnhE subunit
VNVTIARALISWLLLFGLYLALAAQLAGAEMLAAAVGAAIATTVMLAVRRVSRHHFQFSARWLGRFVHLPAEVVADCAVVYLAILRRPSLRQGSGRFQSREFNPGNQHPAARLRRALVTTAVALAPNTFPIGVPEGENALLVHQLVPKPNEQDDPDWPL